MVNFIKRFDNHNSSILLCQKNCSIPSSRSFYITISFKVVTLALSMTFVYGSYLAVNACLITVSKDFSFTVYLTICPNDTSFDGFIRCQKKLWSKVQSIGHTPYYRKSHYVRFITEYYCKSIFTRVVLSIFWSKQR